MRFLCVFMSEKGWYSFTVWLSTARMIIEMAKDKKISVDELFNNLVSNGQNKKWLTCT